MILKAKQFIKQFEIVFHTDWEYTKEQLGTDTDEFEGKQTFIKGEWISNWCNKDDLIEYYLKLKKEYSKENLKQFIYYFEAVFDKDWDYSTMNLGIEEQSGKSKEFDKKMGLETIHIISPEGTFLHPNLTEDELEMANWGNRDLLLKYYKEI